MSDLTPHDKQEIKRWQGLAGSLLSKAQNLGAKYTTLAIVAITYAYMSGTLGPESVTTPVWASFLATTTGIGVSIVGAVLLDFMRGKRITNKDLENTLREQGEKIDESILDSNVELNQEVTHILLEIILSKELSSQEHQTISGQLSDLQAMVAALIDRQPTESQPVLASHRFFVFLKPNKNFVGRELILTNLDKILHPDHPGPSLPVMVWACGGMGKTQLVVEYAYRHREDYPDGIFWMNATQDWRQEAVDRGSALGVGTGSSFEAERQMRVSHAFAEYLNQNTNSLLIFDNVDDPRRLCLSEAGFIPSELKCRVLFTTIRGWKPEYPFSPLEMKILDETEALDLLLHSEPWRPVRERCRTPSQDPETHAAKQICRTLGYLPLALTMASVFLARNYKDVTLESYLHRLHEEGELATVDAAGLDERDLATLHQAAVSATLKIQWDSVKSPDARIALQTVALLEESSPVPFARLSLLSSLSMRSEPGYPSPLREAIRKLEDWTLVDILEGESLRLHPMVREFVRTTIPDLKEIAIQCTNHLAHMLQDMDRLNREVASRGIDAVLGDIRVGLTINSTSKIEGNHNA